MSYLEKLAKARCNDPMSSWPQHNDFHRRNLHPFAGSKSGEMYWDEECLRCQLERAAAKVLPKSKAICNDSGMCTKPFGHKGAHGKVKHVR